MQQVEVAAFASLRWGESAAFRRRHVDLEAAPPRLVGTTTELKDGSITIGPACPGLTAGLRCLRL
ncbi:hypothetical protein HTZ77_40290 [Nonomuraea sp. SMC257]|uniref:Uncharacterized protein n=1 Tax=Nonomuraea montanisoli TaxID=2741721 RepID=A0A7Y6IHA4_9ACTN|nr:hypothetical protein [Nonomuraea montanisoli]NUW37600.1 hypothetical protein [Nonomuraea montanisoli]